VTELPQPAGGIILCTCSSFKLEIRSDIRPEFVSLDLNAPSSFINPRRFVALSSGEVEREAAEHLRLAPAMHRHIVPSEMETS
jgi:hypothetical protein